MLACRPFPRRPEAWEKHQKVCTADRPGGPLGPNKHCPKLPEDISIGRRSGASSAPVKQRPVGYTCYMCGMPFGSASLLRHIPHCQKRWLMEEDLKEPCDQRSLPPPPPEMVGLTELPKDPAAMEAFNQRMYEYWDKVSLVDCPHCHRTFR